MPPACQKNLGPLHDRVSEKRGEKKLDSLPVLLTDDKTRFVLTNTSIKNPFFRNLTGRILTYNEIGN